jgi:magnesium transporter
MHKEYQILDGKIIEQHEGPSQILVFESPDEEEKQFLLQQRNLDEHTLNSALDPDEQSRLEFEDDHIAIIFKRPRNYCAPDQLQFKINSYGVFLFQDCAIIVASESLPPFSGKIFSKITTLKEFILRVFYRSIFHYLEHLKVINMISDELELKINTSMENKFLINLFSLEKSLVYYLNSINSNGAVLDRLKANAAKIGYSPEELEYLDDLIVENTQCFRQAEIYSNILANLMDARVSIVSNNLNILMKTLNIITVGIMVPTFVVSAFSMNVPIPLDEFRYAFWIILGLSASSVAGFLFFWRPKKW